MLNFKSKSFEINSKFFDVLIENRWMKSFLSILLPQCLRPKCSCPWNLKNTIFSLKTQTNEKIMISFRLASQRECKTSKKGWRLLLRRCFSGIGFKFSNYSYIRENLQDETLYPFPLLFSFVHDCASVRCVREKESRSGEFEVLMLN